MNNYIKFSLIFFLISAILIVLVLFLKAHIMVCNVLLIVYVGLCAGLFKKYLWLLIKSHVQDLFKN